MTHNEGQGDRPQGAFAARVMVVDDEREIAELVVSLLQREGMDATAFFDPQEALDAFNREPFDIAILDVMMPGMDGYELCGHLRAVSEVPIVFLSARDEETDQVIGFTLGADDYVCKPFKPRELVARVRAHLRRARRGAMVPGPHRIEVAGIAADMLTHEVTLHDDPLSLTPKEFAILTLLMQQKGRPVPAADIYEHAWQERYDAGASNTVMVHIRHLREKLAAIDSSREFIETVWGVGYRVAVERGKGADAEGDVGS